MLSAQMEKEDNEMFFVLQDIRLQKGTNSGKKDIWSPWFLGSDLCSLCPFPLVVLFCFNCSLKRQCGSFPSRYPSKLWLGHFYSLSGKGISWGFPSWLFFWSTDLPVFPEKIPGWWLKCLAPATHLDKKVRGFCLAFHSHPLPRQLVPGPFEGSGCEWERPHPVTSVTLPLPPRLYLLPAETLGVLLTASHI